MSIHTNAVPAEKASEVDGIETFFLSPARSERAKNVAALENKSDIREMSESSKDVFLESLNRPRITASHKFAIDVQAGILQSARSKYKDINDAGVKKDLLGSCRCSNAFNISRIRICHSSNRRKKKII